MGIQPDLVHSFLERPSLPAQSTALNSDDPNLMEKISSDGKFTTALGEVVLIVNSSCW